MSKLSYAATEIKNIQALFNSGCLGITELHVMLKESDDLTGADISYAYKKILREASHIQLQVAASLDKHADIPVDHPSIAKLAKAKASQAGGKV